MSGSPTGGSGPGTGPAHPTTGPAAASGGGPASRPARNLALSALSVEDVARLLQVAPSTVRSYLSRGEMPAADRLIGRSPVWSPSTIEAWQAGRRGRGWRHGQGDTPDDAGPATRQGSTKRPPPED